MLEFLETQFFTRAISTLLTDAEYSELQGTLVVDPEVATLYLELEAFEKFAGARIGEERASEAASASSTTGTRAVR
jgi:hypothetical protein